METSVEYRYKKCNPFDDEIQRRRSVRWISAFVIVYLEKMVRGSLEKDRAWGRFCMGNREGKPVFVPVKVSEGRKLRNQRPYDHLAFLRKSGENPNTFRRQKIECSDF